MSSNDLNLEKVYQFSESQHPLASVVKSSLNIIEKAISDFGLSSVALSFNGGKDCTVLLHLFCAALSKTKLHTSVLKEEYQVPTLYITSPEPFNEIEEFVESSQKLYNLNLCKSPCPMKTGLKTFLSNNANVKAILIGTRRTDPFGDTLSTCISTSEGWPDVMRIHPILDWEYHSIWTFLRELKVPYCKLYDLGYTSLGDRNNTLPNPLLKNDRIPGGYDPAWKLKSSEEERLGRVKNF